MTMHTMWTVAAIAIMVTGSAATAKAQSDPPVPRIEIGADGVAAERFGYRQVGAAPRVIVNFNTETALDVSADFDRRRLYPVGYVTARVDQSLLYIQIKRTLVRFDDGGISGLLGSGLERHRQTRPAYSYVSNGSTHSVPEYDDRETGPLFVFGI